MKLTPRILLVAAGLVTFGSLAIPFVHANEDKEKPETKVTGSIRPKGHVKKTDLPGLAKISFGEALQAAQNAVSGGVLKAELEIEDGNLQYSFEIVTANKSVTEVEIDAGDGKVLDIDKS
jgi:uncharacterized membrane protein YkoI